MVKRLRHRPFTAVTGVQIPLESLRNTYADVAQFSRNKDCVHDGNIRRTNACINVRLMFSSYRRLHRERENEVFERHAIGKIHTPMWLNSGLLTLSIRGEQTSEACALPIER